MSAAEARRPRPTQDVLARTIWGEARSESVRAMEAVAAVILNRVASAREGRSWWGSTIIAVCRAPLQFSCWNLSDPNRRLVDQVTEDDRVFPICQRIARRAITGGLADPTGGATHYHALGTAPVWADGHIPCARIGRHVFYNTVL
jgi:N-acetylmuramoyl-L-alanine amidase